MPGEGYQYIVQSHVDLIIKIAGYLTPEGDTSTIQQALSYTEDIELLW